LRFFLIGLEAVADEATQTAESFWISTLAIPSAMGAASFFVTGIRWHLGKVIL